MRTTLPIAVAIVVAALLGVAVFVVSEPGRPVLAWVTGLFDSKLIKSCQAVLLDRLRAPTTYRRLAVSVTSEPATIDEYYAENPEPSSVIQAAERARYDHATRWAAIITFDAENTFGVPVRGAARCTHVGLGEGGNANVFTVKVDGKTRTQWLADAIRRNSAGQ